MLGSVSPFFTQNTLCGVTIEIGSNLSKYMSTDSLILAHINDAKTLSTFLCKFESALLFIGKNLQIKIEKEVIFREKIVNSNTI
jgi:hypothetical protein